jgi:threonine dehydratase
VVATEGEIAGAVRLVLRATHNLAEGAGAASFAGLRLLRDRLAGRKVAVVLSGSNIDAETLRRVMNGEI